MNQIPKIIYPLLLRTTQKSYRRSDTLFKLERQRTTPTTSVATSFKQPHIACRTCATHTQHHQKHEKLHIAKEGPIISAYQELIQRGEYRLDPAQLYTLQLLQALANDIHRYVQQVNAQPEEEQQSSGGWWSRVKSLVRQDPITAELQAPRGLYIWGGVGCGKTMLMDLFMHHVHDIDKTRVHFNSFMQSVHQQIHQYRTQHDVLKEDPLDYVVHQIRAQTQLLCFDEFQVTNIADAMLLGRLFDKLWQRHVIVVATSNRPPDDLYKGGLQRALFLPFIAQLKQRCHVHHMTSHVDYRLVGQRMKHIYHVIGAQDPSVATQALEEQWNQLTEQRAGEVSEVSIGYGRVLRVKRALKGIAWFDFAELCDNKAALGVADYAKLCEVYHTLFIVNVPRMSPDTTLNEARRFILLIDECYDHKVKLIISAHTAPEQLFPTSLPATASGGPITGEEEIFAFSRTLSRLHEMQTTEYLEQNHEPHPYHKKDEHHKRHVK